MTEKRFELVYEDYDSFAIRDNDYIQENKHYRTLEEIVALLNQLNTNSKKLNELHEKNQRLKSILQSERRELIEQNNNYRKLLNELKEENEQLKQFKQLVVDFIDQSLEKDKRYYEMTYEDYLNGRIEALEELKKVIEND